MTTPPRRDLVAEAEERVRQRRAARQMALREAARPPTPEGGPDTGRILPQETARAISRSGGPPRGSTAPGATPETAAPSGASASAPARPAEPSQAQAKAAWERDAARAPIASPSTPPTRDNLTVIDSHGGRHSFSERDFDRLPPELQQDIRQGQVLLSDGLALTWGDYTSLPDEWRARYLREGAAAGDAFDRDQSARRQQSLDTFVRSAQDKTVGGDAYDSLPPEVQGHIKQTHIPTADGVWEPKSWLTTLSSDDAALVVSKGRKGLESARQERLAQWVESAIDKRIPRDVVEALPKQTQSEVADSHILTPDGVWEPKAWLRTLSDDEVKAVTQRGRAALDEGRSRAVQQWVEQAESQTVPGEMFSALPPDVQRQVRATHTLDGGEWVPTVALRAEAEQGAIAKREGAEMERQERDAADREYDRTLQAWARDSRDKLIPAGAFASLPAGVKESVRSTHVEQDGQWLPKSYAQDLAEAEALQAGRIRSREAEERETQARADYERDLADWLRASRATAIPGQMYQDLPQEAQRQVRATHVEEAGQWIPKAYAQEVAEAQALQAGRIRSPSTVIPRAGGESKPILTPEARAALLHQPSERQMSQETQPIVTDLRAGARANALTSKGPSGGPSPIQRTDPENAQAQLEARAGPGATFISPSPSPSLIQRIRNYADALVHPSRGVTLDTNAWNRYASRIEVNAIRIQSDYNMSYAEAVQIAVRQSPPPEGLIESNLPLADITPVVSTALRIQAYRDDGRNMPSGELAVRLSIDAATVVAPWAISKVATKGLPPAAAARTEAWWHPITGVERRVPLERVTYLAEQSGKAAKQFRALESIRVEDLPTGEAAARLQTARAESIAADRQLIEAMRSRADLTPRMLKQIERQSGLRGIQPTSVDVSRAYADLEAALRNYEHAGTPPMKARYQVNYQQAVRDLNIATERANAALQPRIQEGPPPRFPTLKENVMDRLDQAGFTSRPSTSPKPDSFKPFNELPPERQGRIATLARETRVQWEAQQEANRQAYRQLKAGQPAPADRPVALIIRSPEGQLTVWPNLTPERVRELQASGVLPQGKVEQVDAATLYTHTMGLPSEAQPATQGQPIIQPSDLPTPVGAPPAAPAPSRAPSPVQAPGVARPAPQPQRRVVEMPRTETRRTTLAPPFPGPATGARSATAPDLATRPDVQTGTLTGVKPGVRPAEATQPQVKQQATGTRTPTPRPVRPRFPDRPGEPRGGTGRPYHLPGGDTLPPGRYPRVVTWPQGFFDYYQDLDTGRSWQRQRAGAWTRSSYDGFKVIVMDATPPRRQTLRMGFEELHIYPDRLEYRRLRDITLRDRTLRDRAKRPNLFRSRRRP